MVFSLGWGCRVAGTKVGLGGHSPSCGVILSGRVSGYDVFCLGCEAPVHFPNLELTSKVFTFASHSRPDITTVL